MFFFASKFTHLLHDARFSLGKCRIPSQLVVDVLHLNLDSSFGFLSIWKTFHAGFLRRCCRCRNWSHCRWCCGDVGRCISVAESIVLDRSFVELLVIFLLPLAIIFIIVIILVMSLQIVFIVSRKIVSASRIKLLVRQLSLRKILMKKFRWVLLKITVEVARWCRRRIVFSRRFHFGWHRKCKLGRCVCNFRLSNGHEIYFLATFCSALALFSSISSTKFSFSK